MTIQLPGSGPHDVVITYITEAPAWKPSYRVVVGKDGRIKARFLDPDYRKRAAVDDLLAALR